ncbi:MAG: tRNA (N6-isopentenyl adenosine(37)-C2)-methylthiotransferase MiaB, partial [Pseudomonadota bacterium]|nr:tRNA (N6-isopentenyl adenosine(37)-C2)-methylthiotransferase MiaB [Pseudomonadota bacterium]
MPKDVQSADNNKKKLFIKTWGCQMNVYDSRRMADILRPFGYEVSEEAEGADMIILNTCHIREKATDKVFSELGRLRRLKDKKEAAGGKMIMAVAGCVAQAEGEFIVERAPYVDLVFGPQTYHELPEMIAKLTGAYGEDRIVSTELDTQNKFDALPEESNDQGVTAFLSVQEGCDKFCTFCVVPYTRGGEFSRTVQQIVDEAKALIDSGAREITLLGQNVNAFHGEGYDGKPWNLPRIIEELAKLNDLERIRYTTSHPRDMEMSLIEAHRDIEKLMPYLHLPVQSGSNKILKAMNRKHERDMYFEIIEDLRKARPD